MAPSKTPHEPRVHIRDPTPHRYVHVPTGNVYITSHCRRLTHAAGQTVYVVMGAGKRKQIGIRVPHYVYEQVKEEHDRSAASRAEAVRRKDLRLAREFEAAVREAFPRLPEAEMRDVVRWTMRKHARRVGRSGRLGWREKATLAVRAHIRHTRTRYDRMMREEGARRDDARRATILDVDQLARAWGGSGDDEKKLVGDEEEEEGGEDGEEGVVEGGEKAEKKGGAETKKRQRPTTTTSGDVRPRQTPRSRRGGRRSSISLSNARRVQIRKVQEKQKEKKKEEKENGQDGGE